MVERAAVPPAMTTVAGWALALVSRTVPAFILSIRHQSAFAGLLARSVPLSLGREINSVAVGGEIAAAFVAEGEPAGVVAGSFSNLTLAPRKIVAIVTFTEDIARNQNLEPALRTLLSAGVSSALDGAFFGASAASLTAPAGILFGLSAVAASALTPPVEAMRDDLRNLVAELDGPIDPCFIVAPSRALWLATVLPADFAYPVLSSTAVPSDRVVCVDAAALALATGDEPRFAVSTEATLHMEDTAAQPIGAAGTPNVVAAPTRSMYQTNTIAVRAILHVTWSARAGGASYLDTPAW